jgi:hypothetical protein
MRTATYNPGWLLAGILMPDLELWRDERFIDQDDSWRRLVGHLDHGVRRDLLGWMGLGESSFAPASKMPIASLAEILEDYVRGAALAINPLPTDDEFGFQSDRAALAADALAVGADVREIVSLIERAIAERTKSDERSEGQAPGTAREGG